MKVIYLIGFQYVNKPNFPYLTLSECGFWTNKNGAQAECDRRNQVEKEMGANLAQYPEFQEGFWSVRETFKNS